MAVPGRPIGMPSPARCRQTPGRPGEILVTEESTLSRNVRRMDQRGRVSPEVGADVRERIPSTTARGQHWLTRAFPDGRDSRPQCPTGPTENEEGA